MGSGASSDPRQRAEVAEEWFQQADVDQDGKLSLDELLAAAHAHHEQNEWTRERILSCLNAYDQNGDGMLDRAEWQAACEGAIWWQAACEGAL
ncbi:hypothetical protein AK812_SmicGene17064 [Symbiodinium microadriaticum]|uniref:EF-hand domain-containing protein n=1 Tax=Symbiodinium microadriaticum TaxID=2951 RepID=A0A1Q9DYQ5_SYMMI|nr:hypothetical protein AK812_SmicGene17064 [Symbiodinium microadriaticum]